MLRGRAKLSVPSRRINSQTNLARHWSINFSLLRVALPSNDPLLLDQLSEWYLRRGWDAQLQKAQSSVQFIKDTNPTTAEQAVQSLIEVTDVLF